MTWRPITSSEKLLEYQRAINRPRGDTVFQRVARSVSNIDPWRVPTNSKTGNANIPSPTPISITLTNGVKGELAKRVETLSDGSVLSEVLWTQQGAKKATEPPYQKLPFCRSEEHEQEAKLVFVEGVWATDMLNTLGVPAVGTLTGPSYVPLELPFQFIPETAVVWDLGDDASARHTKVLASRLLGRGSKVKIIDGALCPISEMSSLDEVQQAVKGALSYEPKLSDALPGEPMRQYQFPGRLKLEGI